MKTSFVNLVLLTILVASVLLMGTTSSKSTYEPLQNGPEYDPWLDYDDDGDIDLYDAVNLLIRYGAKGTPINKTALLLELEARIDALNATVIDLVNQFAGCSEGVVNIKDYSQNYGLTTSPVLGTVTLDFDNPFNSANYYLFTKITLDQDFDPGSGLIPAGTVVFAQNVVKTVANFTAEVWYGEDLLRGAEVDLFYIAIEMGATMGAQAVEGGKYDGKVLMNKVVTVPESVMVIDFERPFTSVDEPELVVNVVLRSASDGLSEGAAVKVVEDIKGSPGNWTGFDLTVSKYSGGSISNNAEVFVTWIAIGTEGTGTTTKGVATISPVAFDPETQLQAYRKSYESMDGDGSFWTDLELPKGVTITNVTAHVLDEVTDGQVGVYLWGYNITRDQPLAMPMAFCLSGQAEVPGEVTIYDDTIDDATIDMDNCTYCLQVHFTYHTSSLELKSIQIEYEYQP